MIWDPGSYLHRLPLPLNALLEFSASSSHTDREDWNDAGYQEMRRDLSGELLSRIKSSSPLFFEHLVVELLVAMGYGASRKDAGEVGQVVGHDPASG